MYNCTCTAPPTAGKDVGAAASGERAARSLGGHGWSPLDVRTRTWVAAHLNDTHEAATGLEAEQRCVRASSRRRRTGAGRDVTVAKRAREQGLQVLLRSRVSPRCRCGRAGNPRGQPATMASAR